MEERLGPKHRRSSVFGVALEFELCFASGRESPKLSAREWDGKIRF